MESSKKKACTNLSSLTEEDNVTLERLFEKYGNAVLEKELHYKHVTSCIFLKILPSGGAGRHILKKVLRMLDSHSFFRFVKTSFVHQFCNLRSNNLLNKWCKYKLKYYEYENLHPEGTPFIVACRYTRFQDVNLFLQNHDVEESGMTLREMVNQTGKNEKGRKYTALQIVREFRLIEHRSRLDLRSRKEKDGHELINVLVDILYENTAVNMLVKKYCIKYRYGTPLILAIGKGCIDEVRTLITNHDINETGITLQQLVNQWVRVRAWGNCNNHLTVTTALIVAGSWGQYNNYDIVDYLVDSAYKNTALNAFMKEHYKGDKKRYKPLIAACIFGNFNNAKIITTYHDAKESGMTLKQMVNQLCQDNYSEESTPLMVAAEYEHYGIVQHLIEECEADPNITGHGGFNALHGAAENRKNTNVLKFLLENMSLNGINHTSDDGRTPLDIAYQSNINNEIKDEIIQVIRQHGGISHKYNENGELRESAPEDSQ